MTIDQAIRNCISSITVEKSKYLEAIKELLAHCDINYKSNEDSQTTLLMLACSLNEYFLVELLMITDYSNSIEKKDKKLNMNLKDVNNRNVFHHLLSLDKNFMTLYRSKSEYNAELNILNIFNFLTSGLETEESAGNKKNKKKKTGNINFNLIFSELLDKDNDGYSSLSLSLIKGYYKLSKQIVSLGVLKNRSIDKFHIKINGNSLLHCAVQGKNINCLYLILSFSSYSDLIHKNKDNLTPADYAKSLNLIYLHKVLKFYESNINNSLIQRYFNSNPDFIDVNNLLTEKFQKENYSETMFLLEKLRVTNSLGDVSSYNSSMFSYHSHKDQNNKNSPENISFYMSNELSISWNSYICQYKKLKKEQNENNIKPESVLSKFIDDETSKKNINPTQTNQSSQAQPIGNQSNSNIDTQRSKDSFYNRISSFFINKISEISIDSYKSYPNLLILLFNKIIFFHKTGNFSGCIKTSLDLLVYLRECQGIEEYFSFFLFLNTTLLLIDVLLQHNLPFLASILIERLEGYLSIKYHDKINECIDEDIAKYLFQIEYLNNGTKTWDEIFSIVNLIKAHRDQMNTYNELKSNENEKYFKRYEELESTCKYKNNLPIFKTLQILYDSIKVKQLYYEGNTSKINKILSSLYQRALNKDMKITINNNQIDIGISNSKEVMIFYYNSNGIVYLKQKKYQLAEYNFKKSIFLCDKYGFNQERKDFNFSISLSNIYILKFNLGLALFYQGKYLLSKQIFALLSKSTSSILVNNPYLWYRYGVSCVELFRINQEETDNEEEISQKDNYLTKTCKGYTTNDGFISKVKVILNYKKVFSLEETSLVNEAVTAFKQILILLNQDIKGNHMLNGNSLYEIYQIYSSSQYFLDDNDLKPLINSNFKTKSHNSLIVSTYFNLFFSLSLLNKWSEVLFYIDDFEKSDYFNTGTSSSNSDIKTKLIFYQIQSYIYLNMNEKAYESISLLIGYTSESEFSYNFQDLRGRFMLNSSLILKDESFKSGVQVGLVKYYFSQGDIQSGDMVLSSIIKNIMKNNTPEHDFPLYIMNLLIYSLLYKGCYSQVIRIIKFKRVYEVIKEMNLVKENN